MRRAFSQIVWGLIFVLVNFRIGGFDVLPDWIGYPLILAGLSTLRTLHLRFKIAWAAAWPLLALSILPLFGIRSDISLTNGETPEVGALAIVSLAMMLQLVLCYGICEGIRVTAARSGRAELAETARNLWIVYFTIGAMTLFLFPFQLNYEQGDLWPFLLLLAVGGFITLLLLIFLVRRAGRELAVSDRRVSDG